MIDFYDRRNLVILALIQIGTIVAGVLAAGLSVKWYKLIEFDAPNHGEFISNYGWLALIMPISWITLAMMEFQRETEEEGGRLFVLAVGVLLELFLLYWVWHGGLGPVLRMCGFGSGYS